MEFMVSLDITVWARVLRLSKWPLFTSGYTFDLSFDPWLAESSTRHLTRNLVFQQAGSKFLQCIPQSVDVGVCSMYCVVSRVEKSAKAGFRYSILWSTFFHRKILRCGGLVLTARVLASTKKMSWSLIPGIALHFSVSDGRLVRKNVKSVLPSGWKFYNLLTTDVVDSVKDALAYAGRVAVSGDCISIAINVVSQ